MDSATLMPSLGPALGRYFHTFDDDGEIAYQGRIIRRFRGGWFEVQFYSALNGSPTTTDTIHKDVMQAPRWKFYDFAEQMNSAWHKHGKWTKRSSSVTIPISKAN